MPTIPNAQSQRIQEINRVFWDALDESLDTLDDEIAANARKAMAKIRKSNYNPVTIKRETKRITGATDDATRSLLAAQVESAALYAQRAADTIRAWEISGRLAEGVEHLTVSESALARARLPGASAIDAEAALSRIKIAPLQSPAAQAKAFQDFGALQAPHVAGKVTSGTKAMAKLRKARLVRKSREIGLSRRLHNSVALNKELTEKAVGQAIREASSMNKAGRDLVSALNAEGAPLAVNQKLTKPLTRLKKAARELQKLSVNQGDPDAMKAATKEFDKSYQQIKKITKQRVDARGTYAETAQKLDVEADVARSMNLPSGKGRPYQILKKSKAEYERATKKQIKTWVDEERARRTDSALSRWLDNKQRDHAERITETESAGAYRSREGLQVVNKSYVKGFMWRRNASMLALDTRRKKDIARTKPKRKGGRRGKRKTKGAPCRICPQLADLYYQKSYYLEYPRGAHPN
ncbi:MAG: hypothetical protein V3W44_10990 [Dehalococcoidales bacterium]